MAPVTITTLGSGQFGMARLSLMDVVLTSAGHRGAVGLLVADLAGVVIGAGAGVIRHSRGGEVSVAGMITMAVAAVGLAPAEIYIIIMGSLPAIVSTPQLGKAESATSVMLTIHGQDNSLPGRMRE